MSNILFIVGLPGSGKTELANKINSENNNKYKIIDDLDSFIRNLHTQYTIPEGANVIKVWEK